MDWGTGLAVYFVIWWISLFMVLPFGVTRVNPDDMVDGEDPGAPAKPRILLKMAINTLLAGVFWAIFYFIHQSGLVSFRG